MMDYKGYKAEVEFDDEAGVFHGRVINTRDVITFEGRSVDELHQAFAESVEDYLNFCKELGREPDRPFSGKFQVRLPPELHRRVYTAAKLAGMSLNSYVANVLDEASAASVTEVTVTAAAPARSRRKSKKSAA